MSSQLGFVIVMADDTGNENIIHYSSVESKRVTRSVLAAELFDAVLAYGVASTARITFNTIFNHVIPLILYTDSKLLFHSIVGINSTTEKRLLIDLYMLRESYEMHEHTEVVWIPSSQNPANALTKEKRSQALHTLMKTNKVSVDPKVWVERSSVKEICMTQNPQKTPQLQIISLKPLLLNLN